MQGKIEKVGIFFAPDISASPLPFSDILNRTTVKYARQADLSLAEMGSFEKAACHRRAMRLFNRISGPVDDKDRFPRERDRNRLSRIAGQLFPGGPDTEHRADEIAAHLLASFPWMEEVIDAFWRDLRASVSRGEGARIRPTLIDGPPGIGKTYLARTFSEALQIPSIFCDAAADLGGLGLSGTNRRWGNGEESSIVSTVITSGIVNPVVCVDEIDKAARGRRSSADGPEIGATLLGLLEPASARSWECPYYGVKFDMSRINWILTANDAHLVRGALRSRVRHFRARQPGWDEILNFAGTQASRQGLDADVTSDFLEVLDAGKWKSGTTPSPRRICQMVDDLKKMEDGPVLN